jgi:sulfatase maturation enzyme AslB (radical SAM superfamily)
MRSETLVRLNRLIASNRLKFLGILAADLLGVRHLILYLDPVQACNLRCGMCHFSDDEWLKHNPVKRFSDSEIRGLADMFFPQAVQLHIGGAMEPTVYKGYPSLVTLGKQYKIPFVGLTTNGQLLTRASIRLMIEAGLDEITLSTHGIKRDTYEQLMQGASFETFHRNLRAIVELKREFGKRHPAIRINYTVNPDNLSELRGFFDLFGDYGITTLQVRPIVDVGNTDYRDKNLTKHSKEYNETIDFLISECRHRGISLLVNKLDPGYERSNKFAVVYEKAVMRYLGPGRVWRDGFDFRSETYRQHVSRIGYRRELLEYVLRGHASLITKTSLASSQLF